MFINEASEGSYLACFLPSNCITQMIVNPPTTKLIKYGAMTILFLLCLTVFFFSWNSSEFREEQVSIDTVKSGLFLEQIPQIGIGTSDTLVTGERLINVVVDELYLPRISSGLKATAEIRHRLLNLEVIKVYPKITNGTFNIEMIITGRSPAEIPAGQRLRLRMELSRSSDQILLPIGGFYVATNGTWIYLMVGRTRAIKRQITLGRRNMECFEVLKGLRPGDRVITSSNEQFGDQQNIDLKYVK